MVSKDAGPVQAGMDLKEAIVLIGPGGAGKTTIGALLARRLGVRFLDLDQQFAARHGDISRYLARRGYTDYATSNVQVLIDLVAPPLPATVIALSSGFMPYLPNVHPAYEALRCAIVANPSTAVLLPSFDLETCVTGTVRRQTQRPFGRSAAREEAVIRQRFDLYRSLAVPQFETMRSVEAVVEDLAMLARVSAEAPR